MGKVLAVCTSDIKGVQKKNIHEAKFLTEYGIEGDAHAGRWHRQVSLLSSDRIEEFRQRGAVVDDGAFGENLVISGIDFKSLPIGTRFQCKDVLLELTQIGKECHHGCAIFKAMGDCIMPREGVFARVLHGGIIREGDDLEVIESSRQIKMRVAVITSSDSGAAGNREDLSGPAIKELTEAAGYQVVHSCVLPDDQKQLEEEMRRICDEGLADLVLTTGGTGFSPRDVMPEATLNIVERTVPGIPEAMRAFSMQITKRSMLSRAAAGIRKDTLIVNLPGSPKAVRECLEYILPELHHGLEILLGRTGECAGK